MHSCRNALFYFLLFNSSLNSLEFKFELNLFESISKNAKTHPFFPFLLAQPKSLSFFFPASPAQSAQSPYSAQSANPLSLPPSVAEARDPPVRAVPFLVPSWDSPPSSGAAGAGAAFLACTPRPLAAPYLRCRGPRLGSL